MEKAGFDEIRIDAMGNILGRIGSGKTVIMMDSHTDTVGIGDPKEWAWDPYKGKVEDGYVYGRGAGDQRAGMACMVYAARSSRTSASRATTRSGWSARCRKRTATACRGSTSSRKTASARIAW